MKATYTNNLKQAFLVLEAEEQLEEDFQIWMLRENEIPGLLNMDIKYVDDVSCHYYDISGKRSLKSVHEKTKLMSDTIKRLVNALLSTVHEIQNYMLDGGGILLDPEYIYLEKESFYFCYYPPQGRILTEEFHRLTEFFVREVDYQDKEGVHLAYTLHKASMDENYSIEKIMSDALNEDLSEGETQTVRYDEMMEEHAGDGMLISEKKEFWEPVKKLLERKKREHWGYWDEVHIEEEDL